MPATVTTTTTPLTGTWSVDPSHSNVEFSVKHLGIATVKGAFREFEGTLVIGEDLATASGTVQVASVDTNEPQRDAHLRSADFFDAENHPELTFARPRSARSTRTPSRSTRSSRCTASRTRSR